MPKKKLSLHSLLEEAASVATHLQESLLAARHERDKAWANLKSRPVALQPGETPITRAAMEAVGAKWHDKWTACVFRHHRMSLAVRECGHFWMSFDSMMGGSMSAYRDLRSMEEVQFLLDVFGFSGEQI